MDAISIQHWVRADADQTTVDAFRRERARLGHFIRRRVPDAADAEDILQDVYVELVQATRVLEPIEQVGAWLFRVARNRITDLFRRRRTAGADLLGARPESSSDELDELAVEDLLPSAQAGPEAAYARRLLLQEIEQALADLPPEQREVFVAHELDGVSFKALAEQTGVHLNTLLSRKRYAVLHLRERLQAIHDDVIHHP
jgi:RNA polymerase sigma factor (sigma-70 family)